jgi:uncharacterized protein YndB with AHSA1/START domain
MKQTNIKPDFIAQASVMIKAPIEKVWKALMDPEASKAFMFGATVTSEWNEGDPITWKGEWKGKAFEDKGTVLRVEPQQLLQYSHFSPLSGQEDIPSNYHTITITLTEEDGGVWVALSQDKNETSEAKEHSEKNWKAMLEALKKYIEAN